MMKINFRKTKSIEDIYAYILPFEVIDSSQLRVSSELSTYLSVKKNITIDAFRNLFIDKDQEKISQLLKASKPLSHMITSLEHKHFKLIYIPNTNQGYLLPLPEVNVLHKDISFLHKTMKEQEKTLYQLTHELKTPLTSLTSYLELLMHANLDPKYRSYVEKMSLALEQGLHQMNSILELSRLNHQKHSINKDVISIKQLINDIEDMFHAELKKKGLYLHVTHKDFFSFESEINVIKQVIINLVSNAIKFTISGGIDIHTELLSKNAQTDLKLTISDTGIGMTDEEQTHIFDQFKQANKNIFASFGGSGLGLSIVNELLKHIDGKIELKSTYGAGSTFTCTLPITLTDDKDLKQVEKAYQLPQKNLHILLVEDNLLSLEATEKLLKHIDLRVTTAVNGKEAISKFREFPYDIILMDVSMPVIDGLVASKTIRKNDQDIPIIAMTANTYQDHVKKCLDHGMTDILYKPFKAKELYQIIHKHSKIKADFS